MASRNCILLNGVCIRNLGINIISLMIDTRSVFTYSVYLYFHQFFFLALCSCWMCQTRYFLFPSLLWTDKNGSGWVCLEFGLWWLRLWYLEFRHQGEMLEIFSSWLIYCSPPIVIYVGIYFSLAYHKVDACSPPILNLGKCKLTNCMHRYVLYNIFKFDEWYVSNLEMKGCWNKKTNIIERIGFAAKWIRL
jgi:hypothetical protein